MRAGKAASERSESPRVRRWLDDTITVQRKSGVLPGSLGFEPRLAQQLRYPLRRIAECEEVASLVTYLASDLAHFINGTMIEIDGGQQKPLMDRFRDP